VIISIIILLPLLGSKGYLLRQYDTIKNYANSPCDWVDPLSQTLIDNVPPEELDSVYIAPYRMYYGAYSLAQMGHYPVGVYFFTQPTMCKNSKDISDKITEAFERANPKWLLTEYPMEDLTFIKHKDDYTLVTTHSEGSLLKCRLYRRTEK